MTTYEAISEERKETAYSRIPDANEGISSSYTCTTVCLPVRGDNIRALESADITFNTTLINVDIAQYEIFRAKVCDVWQAWYMCNLP